MLALSEGVSERAAHCAVPADPRHPGNLGDQADPSIGAFALTDTQA